MREYNYELISDEEKENIINNEIKKLEAQHWALWFNGTSQTSESRRTFSLATKHNDTRTSYD